jgi:hypothetical protein
MKELLLMLGFVVLFAGCAPKYALQKEYIVPQNIKFEKFAQDCSLQRSICEEKQKKDYSTCLNNAYERAKNIQTLSNEKYEKKYQRYLARMNDYNFNIIDWQSAYDKDYRDWQYFRDQCRKNNDKYACDREDDLRYIVKNERKNRPREPREPRMATFTEILATQQGLCNINNECESEFDICFTTQGGKIKSSRVCIENCN